MDLLRFITAGSVDDGKSTLIGRLLYDSKNIMIDQLEMLEKQSKKKDQADIDLALLTDGLRAEREQGITIDVAYRYFSTDKRKFIIADAPGHVQYTRNMITGASNADLIIVLIDARQGVIEQTKRHSIVASLLQIKKVIVAVNKMDLVGYDQDTFSNIVTDYAAIAKKLGLTDVTYIPLSAAFGDNVVDKSENMKWYDGVSLMEKLETIPINNEVESELSRFQVQYVLRPQTEELHDYRGYLGKVQSGSYKKGDIVTVLPAGQSSTITGLTVNGKAVDKIYAGQSAGIELQHDIDISRGDSFVLEGQQPKVENELEVLLCWMDEKPLIQGNKYVLQHNTRQVKAMIKEIEYKIDVNTLDHMPLEGNVKLNEVVKAKIKTAGQIAFDPYTSLKNNGAAILIDETSNSTVAAVLLD
jgi:sulfate adenylyltransferase subunit 1